MPSFVIATNLAIGQIVPNALAGSAFEFAGRDEKVAISAVMQQNVPPPGPWTNTPGDVIATVQFGSDVQLEAGSLMVEQTFGGGPRIPENVIVDDVAAAGDRLVLRLENTSAGVLDVSTVVRILPL